MQEEVQTTEQTNEQVFNEIENTPIVEPVQPVIENKPNNKKKKIIIIVISIIALLALIGGTVFFLTKDKKKSADKKSTEETVEENKEDKDKDIVSDKFKGNISNYKYENYTAKDVTRSGQVLTVYKNSDNELSIKQEDKTYKKVGSVTAISEVYDEEVNFIGNYIVLSENKEFRVYDFTTDKLVYGPVKIDKVTEEGTSFFEQFSEISYELNDNSYETIAFVISEGKNSTLYNIINNQIIKGFSDLQMSAPVGKFEAKVGNNYYIVFQRDVSETETIYYLMDMNTGKIISKSNEGIDVVNYNNELLIAKSYVTKDDNYITKYYDINEKVLFDNISIDSLEYKDGNYYIQGHTHFYIYNKDKKQIFMSNEYTSILMYQPTFALVLDGKKLNLLDQKGNLYTTFIKEFDDERYIVHTMLSGWYTENGKNGIYIVIQDNKATAAEIKKSNSKLKLDELQGVDLGYEYYYVPKTKESGIIGTYIGGYAKPVLYLYPEKETKVTVNFEKEYALTTTYPKFVNEWKVTAKPNGDLYDENGKYYYGLYWEENLNHNIDFSTGFYVTKDNAIGFLEEKLSYIGLSDREANEFIMYWLPILEKNEKNLVYFELTKERDANNKLIISPKPDSVLRIAIHVKKVNSKVNIKEQKLTKFERKGFTAVEWGGVQY